MDDIDIEAIFAEMEKKDEEPIIDIEEKIEEPVIDIEEKIEEPEIEEDDELVESMVIEAPIFKIGDAVKLIPGATYATGGAIPNNLFNSKLYVRTSKNGNYGIGVKTTGRISGSVAAKYLVAYSEEIKAKPEICYLVLIKADSLDIKSRPDPSSKTLKTLHRNGLFTVVGEKNNWGHLKIGGWIPLEQVKKIEE